jgi:hypothetical protein
MLMFDSHWMPRSIPRYCGRHETGGEHGDDQDEQVRTDAVSEPARDDAAADLECAEPQRTCRAEERGDDSENVDRLTGDAIDGTTAEKWLEHAREKLGTAEAIRAIGHAQSDDGVHCPRVQSPVEKCGSHGDVDGLRRTRVDRAGRRRQIEEERLADAVEDKADTHAGREHHRDPRRGPILRALPVLTQRNLSEPGDRHDDCEDRGQAGRDDEEPAQVLHRPVEHRRRDVAQSIRRHEAPHTTNATATTAAMPNTILSRWGLDSPGLRPAESW